MHMGPYLYNSAMNSFGVSQAGKSISLSRSDKGTACILLAEWFARREEPIHAVSGHVDRGLEACTYVLHGAYTWTHGIVER